MKPEIIAGIILALIFLPVAIRTIVNNISEDDDDDFKDMNGILS